MALTFNKFQPFVEAVAEKVHNLGSDTLKVMLTNTIPVATNATLADLSEITAEHGYSAGGSQATISASAQSGGTYKLTLADVTITASGGTIGPFQYFVLYNDTASNNELIGWWNYGSALTLQDGDSFVVDFDGSTGVLTLV